MAEVTFQEEAPPARGAAKAYGLAGSLVRAGVARTEAGANAILLGIALLIILAAGYVFIALNPLPPAPTEEDQASFDALKREGLTP